MRLFGLLFSLLSSLLSQLRKRKEGAEESSIQYLEMKPKFTVNLSEPKKYLMIQVQLLIEDIDAIAKIKKYMAILRHELKV